jgi:periplasmic mercuric ion binding protein
VRRRSVLSVLVAPGDEGRPMACGDFDCDCGVGSMVGGGADVTEGSGMRWRTGLAALVLLIPSAGSAGERTAMLAVQNMNCATCPVAVKLALKRVPGVRDVRVDFSQKIAVVVFDDEKASAEKLAEASRLAGYPATIKE